MKRNIWILSVLVSVNCFSQRLNKNGEKIVSSLEICNFNVRDELYEKSVIRYAYTDNEIVAMDKTTIVSLGDINTAKTDTFRIMYISNNNGTVNRTVPDLNVDYVYAYDYLFNKETKIERVREKFRNGRLDGYIQYNYEYNDNKQLSLIHYRYYHKDRNTNKYVAEEDITKVPINWVDGNMYFGKGIEMNYSEYRNDLNINPSVFLVVCDIHRLFNDSGFEYSTDWFGMKSNNLLSDITGINGVLKYEYHIENIFDSKGNLNEIVMYYNNNGKWLLRKVIKVNYLS